MKVPAPVLFLIDPIRPKITFWSVFDRPISELLVAGSDIIILQHFDSKCHFSRYSIQSFCEFLLQKWTKLSRNSLFQLLENNFSVASDFLNQNLEVKQKMKQVWMRESEDEPSDSSEFKQVESLFKEFVETLPSSAQSDERNGFDTSSSNEQTVPFSSNGNSSEIDVLIESVKQLYTNSNEAQNDQDFETIDESNGRQEEVESPPNKMADDQINENSEESTLYMNSSCVQRLKCVCGQPGPGSHLNLPTSLLLIERQLLQECKFDDQDLEHGLRHCFQHSLWRLYSQLQLLQQNYTAFLRTALLLNDLNLLRNAFFRIQFARDTSLQDQTLIWYDAQCKERDHVRCLDCDHLHSTEPILWCDLLDYIYLNTSADRLIELLLRHSRLVERLQLPISLIQKLAKSEILKRYESSLATSKVQILQRQLSKKRLLGERTHKNGDTNVGRKINLNQKCCSACGGELGTSFEQLLWFKCDHLYHKRCVLQRTLSVHFCLLCE
jgi:hypothetical protein